MANHSQQRERSSPFMAALALSAAMWCGRSPRPGPACGWRCRRPELAGHLQPLGGVGQINAVQANVRFPGLAARCCGRRRRRDQSRRHSVAQPESRPSPSVQDEGARHVAEAARAAGAKALRAHVSAIGADAGLASVYARTKAAGEAAVREMFPAAVIFGRRSCSGRRTNSSTASPRWRGYRRCCP